MKCVNETRTSSTCCKQLSLFAVIILTSLIICLPDVANAGEIILKNGDKLTGKVGAIVGSKVDFTSDILGPLQIDLAQIQTFTTDEAVKIVSEMANDLARGDASVYDVLQNICKTCRIMRSKGLLCEMHKEILPALKKSEVCECEFRLPCKA